MTRFGLVDHHRTIRQLRATRLGCRGWRRWLRRPPSCPTHDLQNVESRRTLKYPADLTRLQTACILYKQLWPPAGWPHTKLATSDGFGRLRKLNCQILKRLTLAQSCTYIIDALAHFC